MSIRRLEIMLKDYSWLLIVGLLLIILINPVFSQDAPQKKRPKIGLVLSGGGARGFAHIGVIKVLEEEGIKVDYIGGTSMGSIIGGLYAMGYSIDSIEKISLSQDWDKVLNDHISRQEMDFEEKYDEDTHIFSLQFKNKKVSIPPGLVYGQNTINLLSGLTVPAFQTRDFKDLNTPFLCMATDLLSGEAIKMDTGNLAVAIRASMSVPSAFVPIEYGPYYLVDGGLINNMPAKEVKALGADILIGVDIQTPLLEQEEIKNLVQVMSQSIFLNSESTFQENIAEIDFLIKPEIDPFTAMDFNRADSLILRGEKKAREMIPQLRAFMDSAGIEPVDARRYFNTFPEMDAIYVNEINVVGADKIDEDLLLSSLNVEDESFVNIDELDERIDLVYGTKLFHTITYHFIQDSTGKVVLHIDVKEASAYKINVGVHYNDYAKAGLLLNLTGRNVGIQNGRLSVDFVLGKAFKAKAKYVVDHGLKPGFGSDIDLFLQQGYLYDYLGKRALSFNMNVMQHHGYGLMSYKNKYRFRLGYELESSLISQEISTINFDRLGNLSAVLFTDFAIDTYDKRYMPTKGRFFFGRFAFGAGKNTEIDVDANGEIIYDDVHFNYYVFDIFWSQAFSIGDHFVIQPKLYYRKNFGTGMPITKLATFGGFTQSYLASYRPFPGYEFMELSGHTAFHPEIIIRHNFWTNHYLSFMGRFLSLNLVLEDELSDNDFYYGWQVEYTYYSIIGPISFSMAEAYPRKKLVFDFSLGFWF